MLLSVFDVTRASLVSLKARALHHLKNWEVPSFAIAHWSFLQWLEMLLISKTTELLSISLMFNFLLYCFQMEMCSLVLRKISTKSIQRHLALYIGLKVLTIEVWNICSSEITLEGEKKAQAESLRDINRAGESFSLEGLVWKCATEGFYPDTQTGRHAGWHSGPLLKPVCRWEFLGLWTCPLSFKTTGPLVRHFHRPHVLVYPLECRDFRWLLATAAVPCLENALQIQQQAVRPQQLTLQGGHWRSQVLLWRRPGAALSEF